MGYADLSYSIEHQRITNDLLSLRRETPLRPRIHPSTRHGHSPTSKIQDRARVDRLLHGLFAGALESATDCSEVLLACQEWWYLRLLPLQKLGRH